MKRPVETTSDLQQALGLRVAELREQREMGVADFAAELNVTERYVQRVEAGSENLTLNSLVKLAQALDTRVADLFVAPTKRDRPAGRPTGRAEQAPRRRVARAKS